MTKDKLWRRYCEKHPHFLNEHVPCRLTVKGLKKLFDQVYEHGRVEGQSESLKSKSPFDRIFGRPL